MLEFADRKRDPLIYGFIAGLLGTIIADVVHWGAVYFGIARSTTGHYLSQLMFPHQEVILPKLLLGEFIHLIAGGIFGILILLLYYLTGYHYAVIKGLGVGVATWILHVAIIPNLIIPRIYVYRTFNEVLVDLAAHLVWGGIGAWFLVVTRPRPGIDKMISDTQNTARPRGRAFHKSFSSRKHHQKDKHVWRRDGVLPVQLVKKRQVFAPKREMCFQSSSPSRKRHHPKDEKGWRRDGLPAQLAKKRQVFAPKKEMFFKSNSQLLLVHRKKNRGG